MTRVAARAEDGITLVEIVVSIAILGIILTTVSLAVTEGYRTTGEARGSLDRSNLSDFSARWYTPDVAGAIAVGLPPAVVACGAGTTALELTTGTGDRIQYAMVTDGDGSTAFVRRVCASPVAEQRIGRAAQNVGATAACVDTPDCRTVTLTMWPGTNQEFVMRATRRVG